MRDVLMTYKVTMSVTLMAEVPATQGEETRYLVLASKEKALIPDP